MPARTPSSPLLWLLFIGVAFAWGSSYFFIKVGLDDGLPAVHARRLAARHQHRRPGAR